MSNWTDIGEQLHAARESKGLALMDVAHTTRIPLSTLRALEDSDYSVFPSPTYARSFLAQYSEFLDVDAHAWIEAFETGDVLSHSNDYGYLQDEHDHIGHAEPLSSPTRKRSRPNKSREESSPRSGTSIFQTLTVFLVTALLIAGGIYVYQKYEPMLSGTHDNDEAATPEEGTAPDTQSPETPADGASVKSTQVVAGGTGETPASAAEATPALPPGVTPTTTPKTTSETPKPRTGPPPKAMVIDEDE